MNVIDRLNVVENGYKPEIKIIKEEKFKYEEDGRIELRNNRGELHSFNDEPAVIESNGTKYWYKNGKLHREDLPAVICPNGIKFYYNNGKRISMLGKIFGKW
jgi:hypothetical protein